MAGCPARKSRATLQLPDLPVHIVDHLLRVVDRRRLAFGLRTVDDAGRNTRFQLRGTAR